MDSLDTIQNLYDTDGLLDILLGIEEYFDNMDLYAYKNWIKGEIVEGPVVDKYWASCTLKFKEGEYPDPVGATILEKQGTKVFVRKDVEHAPIKHPRSEKDMQSIDSYMGNASKPKEESYGVILYKFQIPRKLINPESFDEYRLMVSDFNSNPQEEIEEVVSNEPEPDEMDFDEEQGKM